MGTENWELPSLSSPTSSLSVSWPGEEGEVPAISLALSLSLFQPTWGHQTQRHGADCCKEGIRVPLGPKVFAAFPKALSESCL